MLNVSVISPNRCRSCLRAKHSSRPSTSSSGLKDVDARHKAGHDASEIAGGATVSLRRCGNPLLKLLLRRGADLARRELAVLEHHQRRDRHDAVFRSDTGVLVDVELDDLDLAVERLGNLFQRRRDHAARAAPFRPEIDDHGLACLEHVLFERGVGCFLDHWKTSLFRQKWNRWSWTANVGTTPRCVKGPSPQRDCSDLKLCQWLRPCLLPELRSTMGLR